MGEFSVSILGDLSGGSITPSSPESLGDLFNNNGAAYGTAVWPAANRAIFMPFRVMRKVTVAQVSWVNGGTVSGNVDVGIYDEAGNKIVSTGSVAQAGISALQLVDIADTVLQPGYYYIGMAADNITGIFQRVSNQVIQLLEVSGIQQMAAAFPLPATATFANPAAAYFAQTALHLSAVV